MKNFEEEAKSNLNKYKSRLETDSLWAKIDFELRPPSKGGSVLWLLLLLISIVGLSTIILNKSNTTSVLKINGVVNSNLTQIKSGKTKFQHVKSTSITSPNPLKLQNSSSGPGLGQSEIKANFSTSEINSNKNSIPQRTKVNITSSRTIPFLSAKKRDITNLSSKSDVQESGSLIPIHQFPPSDRAVNNDELSLLSLELKPLIIYKTNPTFTLYPAVNNDCPKWKDRIDYYLGIYAGIGYPFKTLTAKNSNADLNTKSRLATETVLEELTFGAQFGLKFYKDLFFETGFEYNRINERFDWTKTITDTIGQYIVTGFIVNSPKDTTFIKDTTNVTRVTNYHKKIFNNYNFYSIPLSLGFEFLNGSKASLYVKAGVLFNLSLKAHVQILDENGLPAQYPLSEDESNYPFKSKVSITPFVGIGTRYHLSDYLDLFGEINYRRLNDISMTEYPIKQSYKIISGNIGLQLKF